MTSCSSQWERTQLHRIASHLLKAEMLVQTAITTPTARGSKRVWLSSVQNMLSMIAPGYFRVLSPLTSSNAGSSQAPCPAMDTPSTGALCWPVTTKVSCHSAVSVTPHPLRMLACSHQSCLTHGVARGITEHLLEVHHVVALPPQRSPPPQSLPNSSCEKDEMFLLEPRGPAAANDNFWKWDKATEGSMEEIALLFEVSQKSAVVPWA